MHRRHAFTLASLFAAVTLATAAAHPSVEHLPLIERKAFFGNPTRTAAQLSPDGRWLSWIAPRDGVLNVWVAPAGDMASARALTNERIRPIRSHFWAPDSSQILFINDKGGDENFLLYGVDLQTGAQRNYTPFEKTQVRTLKLSRDIRDRILIGVNNRDPRWHDVHELDLRTGKLKLVFQNDGYSGMGADEALNLRYVVKARPDGGSDFFRMVNGRPEARPFESTTLEDAQTTTPLRFSRDGRTLYWLDSRGRDTNALVAQDWATGRKTVLAQSARSDLGGAIVNPKTGRPDAYAEYYLKREWRALDPALRADLAALRRQLTGEWNVVSRTDADDAWIVVHDPVTAPVAYFRYDRRSKQLTRLFVTRPELEGAPLAPMHPVEIRSRDGLTLPSYLTLPVGSDADENGRPERPVPMVLLVHGGPWSRDNYGFNGAHQWLANRGYAVMSVNYRASTGFGKKFISAGDLQWGRKMHDDLIDAVDWAVRERIAPKDKVAIYGGSYGGYATLAGLTFTPETFACGVDIVGPSNLQTLLKTTPAYWEAVRLQFYKRMGDPNTEEGRRMLDERSPLYSAHKIKRPLLIGQGANDPRVNVAESDQIVKAMQARNIPVTYVLFPDEGHGFARPENSIAFNAVAENFLKACLGGRAEPIGEALRPSTAQVPVGAEMVPGLREALPVRTASGTN